MSNRKFWMGVAVVAAMLAYSSAGLAGEQYTERSLRGNYGFSGSGTLLGSPAAVVGLSTFDGAGGCHTEARLNLAATLALLSSSSCSYVVNEDGTGHQSLSVAVPRVGSADFVSEFVIVDGTNEVHFILRDESGLGTVASGVSKKQAGGDE